MSRIAIVSAMSEELRGLQGQLSGATHLSRAGRDFWVGQLGGHEAVLALSRIGKVASATTAAVLLTEFKVDWIVFTGVAGGLGLDVRVGDIVVADSLLQHDMDASPLFPRYEVPLYDASRFPTDPWLSAVVKAAAESVLKQLTTVHDSAPPASALQREHLADFGLTDLRVHRGLILSGDQFVSSMSESRRLQEEFPEALAVEMEGAAISQVCKDFGVPFAVLRTVSDRADDLAHLDFNRFIADIASRYTVAVMLALTNSLNEYRTNCALTPSLN